MKSEVQAHLPLVFASRLVEDVFLAIDSQDTVFHHALPILVF